MQFVGKVISSVSEFYKDINPATLSGAIDVIVVEDTLTGTLTCSPFHVRFGKLQLLRPQEKVVELCVNGEKMSGERLRMKVGEAGETFFVLPRHLSGEGGVGAEYLTSPLISAQTPLSIEVRSVVIIVRMVY
jgi:phosphatidate phosphatase LPIN